MVEWYWWLLIPVALAWIIFRWVLPVHNHQANVLGRQASKMGWVADGVMLDNDGYRNLAVKKNGMKAVIKFSGQKVILVQPPTGRPFNDFVELEAWVKQEAAKPAPAPAREAPRPAAPLRPAPPEPRVIAQDQRDYHPVLDEMVAECATFIRENGLLMDENWPAELHAEAIVYLACYNAKLGSRHQFSLGGWNTFKTSVENRMRSVREVDSPGKGVETPGRFVSYTTGYHSHLSVREKLARPAHEGSTDLADYLLEDLGGGEETRDVWRTYFSKLVARGAKDVLFKAYLSFEC